jgi:hypothetical protein
MPTPARLLTLLAVVFGLVFTAARADLNLGGWKRLGQKQAAERVDRDEIQVGADEGTFKSIKLEVLKSDIEFISVRVVFSNGADQEIQLKDTIRAGGETRAIDLDGRNRNIRKVVFIFKTDRKERRPGTVVLYGRN